MPFSKLLSTLILSGGVSYASSLAVYQDYTFYTYTPTSDFVGFSKNTDAKCKGSSVALIPVIQCPQEQRLCQDLDGLKSLKKELRINEMNINILENLISLPEPETIDAKAWIGAAKLLAKEEAALAEEKESLKKEIKQKSKYFYKQAPSFVALKTHIACPKALTLKIPHGQLSFSTHYEANLKNDEMTVTQNLSIVNRSGIDIKADSAMFYYRSSNQYVHPSYFSPWIVSKYVPHSKKMYKRASVSEAPVMELSVASESVMEGNIASVASYEDAREYKISNLSLASTGVPLEVEVLSWKTVATCVVKAYPYKNSKAFHVCSFTPKYQIDSNRWKIKSGTEVINENAVGEYRDGKYQLYTKVEEDIKILRKSIVKKERTSGIFGSTIRKKDGFTLILTNKSDKVKKFTVIERIPTSTTTEIKSKLLSITSKKKVDYKILKDGQIEMSIRLEAYERKKIDVRFEISYDKDLKVRY
ncbi:Aspartate ammonia-lyase [hydrothermal vent metagenome]|uniref:Aspartate ammonia-lyase n=1 Tax=hydrothermal vent metagenome TaxID=652676 RepID=A0A1W1CF26_9ZZZZ